MIFAPTSSDPYEILQEYGKATNQLDLINKELSDGGDPVEMVGYLKNKGSIAVGERADQIRSTESWGGKIINALSGMRGEETLYAPPEVAEAPGTPAPVSAIAPMTAQKVGGVAKMIAGIPANILAAAPEVLSVGLEDLSERVGDNVVGETISDLSHYIHGGAQDITGPFKSGTRGLMEAGKGSLNPLVGWKNMTSDEKEQWVLEALAQNIPQLALGYGAAKLSGFEKIIKAKGAIGKLIQAGKPTGLLAPTYGQEASEIFGGQMEEKRLGNRENVDLIDAAITTYISSQSEGVLGGTKAIGDILAGAGVKGKNLFSSILRETVKTGLQEGLIQEPFQTAMEEVGKSGWKAITDPEQLMSKTLPAMIESGVAAGISSSPVGGIHGAKDYSRSEIMKRTTDTQDIADLRAREDKQRAYYTNNIPQIISAIESQSLANLMAMQASLKKDSLAPTGLKEAVDGMIAAKTEEATKAGIPMPDKDELAAAVLHREVYTDSSSPLLGAFKLIENNDNGTSLVNWHGKDIVVPTIATKSPSSLRFDQMSSEEANATLDFLHDSGFVNARSYQSLQQQLQQSPENLAKVMLNFQTVRDDLSGKLFKATSNKELAKMLESEEKGKATTYFNDAILRAQLDIYSGHVADTVPHEIAHPIWHSLPDSFKQQYAKYAEATRDEFLESPIGRTYAKDEGLLNYVSDPSERFAIEFAEAYYVPALREHIQRQKYMGSSIGRMVLAAKDFVRKMATMTGIKPTGIAADVAIKNAKVTPEQMILINKQYKDMAGFMKPKSKAVTALAVKERKAAEDSRQVNAAVAEEEAIGALGEDIEHPDYASAGEAGIAADLSDVEQVKRAAADRAGKVMGNVVDERKRQRQEGQVLTGTKEAIGTLGENIERPDIQGAVLPAATESAANQDFTIPEAAYKEEVRSEVETQPPVDIARSLASEQEHKYNEALLKQEEAIDKAQAEEVIRQKEAIEWVKEYTPEQQMKYLSDEDRAFYRAFSGKGVENFSLKGHASLPYGVTQPPRSVVSVDIRGKHEQIMVNPNLMGAYSFSKFGKGQSWGLRGIYDEDSGNLLIFSPMVLHNWVKEAIGWEPSQMKKGIHIVLNDIDLMNLRANNPETSFQWKDAKGVSHSLFDRPEDRVAYKEANPDKPATFDRKNSKGMWSDPGAMEKLFRTGKKEEPSRKSSAIADNVTTLSTAREIIKDVKREIAEYRNRKQEEVGTGDDVNGVKGVKGEQIDADLSDIKSPIDPGYDELESFEKLSRFNGRIVGSLANMVGRLSKSHLWEKGLGSPEHFKHPVLKELFSLFSDVRDYSRHMIFHKLDYYSADKKAQLGITHVKAEKLSDALADLKYEGSTDRQKKFNLDYESKQYKLLTEMVEDGDIHYVRNRGEKETATNMGSLDERQQRLIDKWREKGASDTTIDTWRMMRHSYDTALDLQLDNMAKLKELLEAQPNTAQTERMKDALTKAMEDMNSWRGFYAPRIRNRGDWVIRAKKKGVDAAGNPRQEFFRDNAQTEAQAILLAEQLHQSGWDVAQPFKSPKPPEDVYNAVKLLDVRQLLNAALERMNESAKSEKDLDKRAEMEMANITFSEDIIESIANVMRERGYRSTAIRRGESYVSGYNVDPLNRFIWYVSNTSNGMAKATVAQQAIRLMAGEMKKDVNGNPYRTGGLNSAQDKLEYETARDYISNQLRNSTYADTLVGYGKAAAAIWFLTSPKSALVNLLALVTNAPPVISHVVTGGKYGPHKVATDISTAVRDLYNSWRGESNSLSSDDTAFMQWVKENEYDAPEFTRASLGLAKSPTATVFQKVMDKAMWFFAKTEKLNRGATLLASYRIARDQMGMNTQDARKVAAEATWKTHGKYGKASDIMLAQGTGLVPRIAQMAYTFAKFPHNHLQMMKRMATKEAGMTHRDWKNFCWMLMMPMMLVGGAGLPFKDEWFKLFGAIASMFGFKGDAQKFFHDQVRANLGSRAEKFARSGLLGQAGIDVSGSYAIGTPNNISVWNLGGAAGGVLKNMVDAHHFLKTGQPERALEVAVPTVLSNVLKAQREIGGVKTRQGYTLFTPEGLPYIPDPSETMLRALGFRSSEEAMQSARVWEMKKESKIYDEERKDILEEMRSAVTFRSDGTGVVDKAKLDALMSGKALRFNKSVDRYNKSMGYRGEGSLIRKITPDSVKTQIKNATKPRKQQMRELKTLQQKGEY